MSFFTKQVEVVNRWNEKEKETIKVPRTGRIISTIVIIAVLLLTFFISWTIIPTGYTGVRTTFGQISQESVPAGFAWKIPFVESIEKVNNKQQDIKFEGEIWSETSERTALFYDGITVTYQINGEKSAWIFANVANYRDTLINNGLVASAIKTASKQLNSVDATNRGLIEPLAQKTLQESLDTKYGTDVIYINKVVISNVDFEESYNNAIASKQNAQIEYEKQQLENQKAIEKAEADAQVKKTNAQAEADAKLIEAEAEAEANRKVASSLSETILEKMYYEKWNGSLPQVYGGVDGNLIEIPLN